MKKINKTGISLIELLIAIAIIGIMSLLAFPNYIAYKKTKSMDLAKVQILGDARKIQNYALSTVEFTDGTFPQNGYGIHFDKSVGSNSGYIIFADFLGDTDARSYDTGEYFEYVALPEGVTITDIEVNGISHNDADYVVTPPYGSIYINGDISEGDTVVSVSIDYSNGSTTSSIELNGSGSID